MKKRFSLLVSLCVVAVFLGAAGVLVLSWRKKNWIPLSTPASSATEVTDVSSTSLLAPSQEGYRTDPQIMAVLRFLSHRWNVSSIDALSILVVHHTGSLTELGIVDASSLTSGRVLIPAATFPNSQQLLREAIAHENDIYLVNEFRPITPQQVNIARMFYATPTPSLQSQESFAVIVWWNVAPSGDGNIKALTTAGYLKVPVMHGVVQKSLGYYAN